MRALEEFSHRFGLEAVDDKGLLMEIRGILNIPGLGMARGSAANINEQVRARLAERGWVLDARVHPSFNLDINALKDRIGLTVQTGNITRAFYDLLKFQTMYLSDRIDAATLIVPTSGAARVLGANIANYTRVTNELALFRHIITVPCIVLGVDEEETP